MTAPGPLEPTRIAFVVTRSDTIGGSSVHIRDLSTELTRAGHAVRVFAGGEGPFADQIRARGVPYEAIPHLGREVRPTRDVRAYVALRRALRRFDPDVVSLHTAKAGWLGRLVARGMGVPVLYTPHGWAFAEGVPPVARWAYATAERVVAPLATRIVNVCEADRTLANAYGVGSSDRHVVIYNGMPDVPADLRATPGRSPPHLVSVARFEPQKDHATLIDALARIADVPWTAELIGDGPLMDPSRARVRQLGLERRITFAGRRDDVAERLARGQAFLLCSHWEGFPRSILEAMRAGLPVLASDVAGVREAVVDAQTGFTIPRGSVEGWAHRLARLVADAELRHALGAAGRRRYEESFTFDRMYRETVSLYGAVRAGSSDR